MENKNKTYLEKPADFSREKAGEGYPLLLYMESDGKKQHWDQEKYPCFFWQVSVDKDTEHMDIAEQMRSLVEEFPIDVSRIYGKIGRAHV